MPARLFAKRNCFTESFRLASREDFLLCELCAMADSLTTMVMISPERDALRSATMGRSLAVFVGHSEPPVEAAEEIAVSERPAARKLKAYLDTVFIDYHCSEIFARIGIANGNGVALRTVFHGESLHRNQELAVTG